MIHIQNYLFCSRKIKKLETNSSLLFQNGTHHFIVKQGTIRCLKECCELTVFLFLFWGAGGVVCSTAHGRKLLLFLFATALLSGPVTNTLENTERAAASLLCGAELAANQTQELMQRAATPLYSKSLLCPRSSKAWLTLHWRGSNFSSNCLILVAYWKQNLFFWW